MELLERVKAAAEAAKREGAAAKPLQAEGAVNSQIHCAYNQTREIFLGLEVRAADLSSPDIGKLMSERPLKSDEGVWMKPFRGIPTGSFHAPLDLIYLDEQCRVIDMVESVRTFQVSSSSPQPASVLALPAHSIFSSQTQAGDLLVLCPVEEMPGQLERLTSTSNSACGEPVIAGAVVLRENPLWSGGPGLLELEDRTGPEGQAATETHEMDLTQPEARPFRQPRNWLQRWWSPDPGRAPRVQQPGLAAYYWNGAAPVAHRVRDISASGLYVVTEDRWYPGTLVLMTLQRTDRGEEYAECTISVQTRGVRWGPDGVGLQFVLADEKDLRHGKVPIFEVAGRREFDRFLEQLRNGK